MKPRIDYTLYLVTDRSQMNAPTLTKAVESAIKGGCTLVQLREKTASSREFYDQAQELRVLTRAYNIPLIINDRVDIALAVDAEGVHIGQHDLPAHVIRTLIGPTKIMGVSAHTLAEAQAAVQSQADYLGIGAMFATPTKPDAATIAMTEYQRIRRHIRLPLVLIGGLTLQTIPQLSGCGADGMAVVSAILAQPDIERAASDIKETILRGKAAERQ
ncbi:MAG: thiamine phosphate synthase [Gracilibacteraceae bacterium]|nr:thiamine phosphate synthase [Gracilibacteraceae bacterium]